MARTATQNRILLLPVLLLLLAVTLLGLTGGMESTVALEQDVRCGMTEHLHSEKCYVGDVLVCGQKAHTHGENCYLVLLRDNDINELLHVIGNSAERSLEAVLTSTLEGVRLQPVVTDPSRPTEPSGSLTTGTWSGVHISALNEAINSDTATPSVTLNENLNAVNQGNGQSVMVGGNVATQDSTVLSVDPSTGNNALNFYIYVVDEAGTGGAWECYNNEQKYDVGYVDGDWYTRRIEPNNVYTVFNNIDGVTYDSTEDFVLGYSTSESGNYLAGGVGTTWFNTVFTFGSRASTASNVPLYIRLYESGTSTLNDNNAVKFCKITYIGADGSATTSYVKQGTSIAVQTPPTDYVWTDQDGNTYTAGSTINAISKSLVLTATKSGYTVTFNSNGGSTVDAQTVAKGGKATAPAAPARTGYTFAGWYTDTALTQEYDFSAAVDSNITLYAKWTANKYRVTFIDENNATTEKAYSYGETIPLGALTGDWVWVGSDGNVYQSGASYTVSGDITFTATDRVRGTFVYANGTSSTSDAVTPGTEITLPDVTTAGNVWVDENGTVYHAGDEVELNQNMTFTEKAAITVSYDVNFPSSTDLSDRELALRNTNAEPKLVGNTPVLVADGSTAIIQNVSDQNVDLYLIYSQSRYGVAHFLGWETETGVVLSPNTNLDKDTLATYDANNDGTVGLTGKWNYQKYMGANFFIRYNAGTDTGTTHSTQYTDVIFTTYVGGLEDIDITQYTIDGLNAYAPMLGQTDGSVAYNAKNYYEYDQQIRALYGEKSNAVWLAEFPNDADMLKVLQTVNTNETLYAVESSTGNMVAVSDRTQLTPDNYTIRWYMFKYCSEASDSGSANANGTMTWHIDGLLVKKQGQITINKHFNGDENAVAAAEGSFYITAQNGTMSNDGFTAATGTDAKSYTLNLNNADSSETDSHSYTWVIEGVSLGEYWQITEHPNKVTVGEGEDAKEYTYYAEYSVRDTDGVVTSIAEYGTTASVLGKTYALDEDPDQGLLVDFANYYYPSDSLMIKKEDQATGKPIGGAAFEIWQPNSEGVLSKLRFSEENGQYVFDGTGTITSISTGAAGYTDITLSDFSYDSGAVILKEITAPSGYDLAPLIEIRKVNGVPTVTGVYYEDAEGNKTEVTDDFSNYAEVHDGGMTLIVKDTTSQYVRVAVEKVWDPVDAAEEAVTVVLQANGGRATNTFPALANAEVVLNADNSWKYVWTDLPAYANGELVEWSVKEIKVGEEPTLADGSSFANWINTVTLLGKFDEDSDGDTDLWKLQVSNTPRRVMLIIDKVDDDGGPLTDVTFTLQKVELTDGTWTEVGSAATATADANGVIHFDNLTAGAYYRLTEIQTPMGYQNMVPGVILTIDGEGKISQVAEDGSLSDFDGQYLIHTGAYNLRVVNPAIEPLPETGGVGTFMYKQSGLMLMLAAAALYVYKKRRYRREGEPS